MRPCVNCGQNVEESEWYTLDHQVASVTGAPNITATVQDGFNELFQGRVEIDNKEDGLCERCFNLVSVAISMRRTSANALEHFISTSSNPYVKNLDFPLLYDHLTTEVNTKLILQEGVDWYSVIADAPKNNVICYGSTLAIEYVNTIQDQINEFFTFCAEKGSSETDSMKVSDTENSKGSSIDFNSMCKGSNDLTKKSEDSSNQSEQRTGVSTKSKTAGSLSSAASDNQDTKNQSKKKKINGRKSKTKTSNNSDDHCLSTVTKDRNCTFTNKKVNKPNSSQTNVRNDKTEDQSDSAKENSGKISGKESQNKNKPTIARKHEKDEDIKSQRNEMSCEKDIELSLNDNHSKVHLENTTEIDTGSVLRDAVIDSGREISSQSDQQTTADAENHSEDESSVENEKLTDTESNMIPVVKGRQLDTTSIVSTRSKTKKAESVVSDAECFLEIHVGEKEREDLLMDEEEGKKNERKRLVSLVGEDLSDVSSADFDDELTLRYEDGEIEDQIELGHQFEKEDNPDKECESGKGDNQDLDYESEKGVNQDLDCESEKRDYPDLDGESNKGDNPDLDCEFKKGDNADLDRLSEKGDNEDLDYESEEGDNLNLDYDSEKGKNPDLDYECKIGDNQYSECDSEKDDILSFISSMTSCSKISISVPENVPLSKISKKGDNSVTIDKEGDFSGSDKDDISEISINRNNFQLDGGGNVTINSESNSETLINRKDSEQPDTENNNNLSENKETVDPSDTRDNMENSEKGDNSLMSNSEESPMKDEFENMDNGEHSLMSNLSDNQDNSPNVTKSSSEYDSEPVVTSKEIVFEVSAWTSLNQVEPREDYKKETDKCKESLQNETISENESIEESMGIIHEDKDTTCDENETDELHQDGSESLGVTEHDTGLYDCEDTALPCSENINKLSLPVYLHEYTTKAANEPTSPDYHHEYTTKAANEPTSSDYHHEYTTKAANEPTLPDYHHEYTTKAANEPTSQDHQYEFISNADYGPTSHHLVHKYTTSSDYGTTSLHHQHEYTTNADYGSTSQDHTHRYTTNADYGSTSQDQTLKYTTNADYGSTSQDHTHRYNTNADYGSTSQDHTHRYTTNAANAITLQDHQLEYTSNVDYGLTSQNYDHEYSTNAAHAIISQDCDTSNSTNGTWEKETRKKQIPSVSNTLGADQVLTSDLMVSDRYDEDSQQDLFSDYNKKTKRGEPQTLLFTGKVSLCSNDNQNSVENGLAQESLHISPKRPVAQESIERGEDTQESVDESFETQNSFEIDSTSKNIDGQIKQNIGSDIDLAFKSASRNVDPLKDLYDDVSESDTSICLQNESTPTKKSDIDRENDIEDVNHSQKPNPPMIKSCSDPGVNSWRLKTRRKTNSESTCLISDDEESLEKSKTAVEQYRKIISGLKLKQPSDCRLSDNSGHEHGSSPLSKRINVPETISVDTAVSGKTAAKIADALGCCHQETKSRPKIGSTEDKLARICRIMENVKSRNTSHCSKSPKRSKEVLDALTPQKTGAQVNKANDTLTNKRSNKGVSEISVESNLSLKAFDKHTSVQSPEPKRGVVISSPPSAKKSLYVQVQDVSETINLQNVTHSVKKCNDIGDHSSDTHSIEIEHDDTGIIFEEAPHMPKSSFETDLNDPAVKSENDDLSEYQKSILVDVPVAVEAHKKKKPKIKKGGKEPKPPTKRRSAWSLKISIAKQPKRSKFSTRSGGERRPSDNAVRDLDEMLDVKPDISLGVAFDHIQKSFYSKSLRKKDSIIPETPPDDIVVIEDQSLDFIEEYSSSSQSEYTSDINSQLINTQLPILNSEPVVVLERIDTIGRTYQSNDLTATGNYQIVTQSHEFNDSVIGSHEIVTESLESNQPCIGRHELPSQSCESNELVSARQEIAVKSDESNELLTGRQELVVQSFENNESINGKYELVVKPVMSNEIVDCNLINAQIEQIETDIETESVSVEPRCENIEMEKDQHETSRGIVEKKDNEISSRVFVHAVQVHRTNNIEEMPNIGIKSSSGRIFEGTETEIVKTPENGNFYENKREFKSVSSDSKNVEKLVENKTQIKASSKHDDKLESKTKENQRSSKSHDKSGSHGTKTSSGKNDEKSVRNKLETYGGSRKAKTSGGHKIEVRSSSKNLSKSSCHKMESQSRSKNHEKSGSHKTEKPSSSKRHNKTVSYEIETLFSCELNGKSGDNQTQTMKNKSKSYRDKSSGHKLAIQSNRNNEKLGYQKTDIKSSSKSQSQSDIIKTETKSSKRSHQNQNSHKADTKSRSKGNDKPDSLKTDTKSYNKSHGKPESHQTDTKSSNKSHGKPESHQTDTKSSNKSHDKPNSHKTDTKSSSKGHEEPASHQTDTKSSNKSHDKPASHQTDTKSNNKSYDKTESHKTDTRSSIKSHAKTDSHKTDIKSNTKSHDKPDSHNTDTKSSSIGLDKPDGHNKETEGSNKNVKTENKTKHHTSKLGHEDDHISSNKHNDNTGGRNPERENSKQCHDKVDPVHKKKETPEQNLSILTKEILQNLQPIVQLEKLSNKQIRKFTGKQIGGLANIIDRNGVKGIGNVENNPINSSVIVEKNPAVGVCTTSSSPRNNTCGNKNENIPCIKEKNVKTVNEEPKSHKTSDFQSEFEKFQLSVERERELMRGIISSSESDNADPARNFNNKSIDIEKKRKENAMRKNTKETIKSVPLGSVTRTIDTYLRGDASGNTINESLSSTTPVIIGQFDESKTKGDTSKTHLDDGIEIDGEGEKGKKTYRRNLKKTNKDKIVAVTEIEANGSRLMITEFEHAIYNSPAGQIISNPATVSSPNVSSDSSPGKEGSLITIPPVDNNKGHKRSLIDTSEVREEATKINDVGYNPSDRKVDRPPALSNSRNESSLQVSMEINNATQDGYNKITSGFHEERSSNKDIGCVIVTDNAVDEDFRPATSYPVDLPDMNESSSNESSTVCYEHTFSDDEDDIEIPMLENEAKFGNVEFQSNSEFNPNNSIRQATSTPKPQSEVEGTSHKINQQFVLTNANIQNWDKNGNNSMDMDSENSFARPESTKVVKRQSRGVLIGERNIVGRRKIFAKPRGCISRKLIETCTKQFIDNEKNDTSESEDNLSYMERQKKYKIIRSRQWVEEHMNADFCVSVDESENERKIKTSDTVSEEKQKENLYYQRTFERKNAIHSPGKGRRRNEKDFSKISAITWKVDRDKKSLIRTSDSEDNFETIKKRSPVNTLTRTINETVKTNNKTEMTDKDRRPQEENNTSNRNLDKMHSLIPDVSVSGKELSNRDWTTTSHKNCAAVSRIHNDVLSAQQTKNHQQITKSPSKKHQNPTQLHYSEMTFDLNLSSESSCDNEVDQTKIKEDKKTTSNTLNTNTATVIPATIQWSESSHEPTEVTEHSNNELAKEDNRSRRTERNILERPRHGAHDLSDLSRQKGVETMMQSKDHARPDQQIHTQMSFPSKQGSFKRPCLSSPSTSMARHTNVNDPNISKPSSLSQLSGLEGMQRQARSIRRSMVAVVRRQNTGVVPKRFYESSEESDVTSCDESSCRYETGSNDEDISGCEISSLEQVAHSVGSGVKYGKNKSKTKHFPASAASPNINNYDESSNDGAEKPKRARGRPRKTDLPTERRDHGNIFENIDKMNCNTEKQNNAESAECLSNAASGKIIPEKVRSFIGVCNDQLERCCTERGKIESISSHVPLSTETQAVPFNSSPRISLSLTPPKLEQRFKNETDVSEDRKFSPSDFIIDSKLALGDSPAYAMGSSTGVKKIEDANDEKRSEGNSICCHDDSEQNGGNKSSPCSIDASNSSDNTHTTSRTGMMAPVITDSGYEQDNAVHVYHQQNIQTQRKDGDDIAVPSTVDSSYNQATSTDPLGLNRGIGFQNMESRISLEYGKMSPLGTYVRKDKNIDNSLSDSVFKIPAPVAQKTVSCVIETSQMGAAVENKSESVTVQKQTSLLEKVFGCNTRTDSTSSPKKRNVMFVNLTSRKARDMAKKRKEEKTMQPKKPNVQFFFPKKRKMQVTASVSSVKAIEGNSLRTIQSDGLPIMCDDQPSAKKAKIDPYHVSHSFSSTSNILNDDVLEIVNELTCPIQNVSNITSTNSNNTVTNDQIQTNTAVSSLNQYFVENTYQKNCQQLEHASTESSTALSRETRSPNQLPMDILQDGNVGSSFQGIARQVTSLRSDSIAVSGYQQPIDSSVTILDTLKTEQTVDQSNLLDLNYIFDVDIITDSSLYSNPLEQVEDKTKTLNEINMIPLPISTDVSLSPLQIPVSGLGMSPLYTTSLSDLNMTPIHYSGALDETVSPNRISAAPETMGSNSNGSACNENKVANDIYIIGDDDDDDCDTDDVIDGFGNPVAPENLLDQEKIERRRKLQTLYSSSIGDKGRTISNQTRNQSKSCVSLNESNLPLLSGNKKLNVSVEKLSPNELQQRPVSVNHPTYADARHGGLLHDYRPWHCALCKEKCNLKKQLIRHINIVHEISQFDPRLKNYICRIDDDDPSTSQKNGQPDKNHHDSCFNDKQIERTTQTISNTQQTATNNVSGLTNNGSRNKSTAPVINLDEDDVVQEKRNYIGVVQEITTQKEDFDDCWKCLICENRFRTKIDVIQHVRMKHRNAASGTSYSFIPASQRLNSTRESINRRNNHSDISNLATQTISSAIITADNVQVDESHRIHSRLTATSQNFQQPVQGIQCSNQLDQKNSAVTKAPKVLIKRKQTEKEKTKMKENSDILVITSSSSSWPADILETPVEPEIDLRNSLSVKWYCKLCPNWYRLRKSCHQHVHKDHGIKGNWSRFYFHNSQQVSFHPSMEICTGPHVDRNAHNFCIVCGRSYSDYNEMMRHIRRNHSYIKDKNREKCILDKRMGKCIVVASDIFLDLHVYVIGDGSARIIEKEFFSELFILCTESSSEGDFKPSDIAIARQIKRILFENGLIQLDSHERLSLADVSYNYDVYKLTFQEDYQWDRKTGNRNNSGDVVMDVCDSDDEDQTERNIQKVHDPDSMESESSNQSTPSDTVNSPVVTLHRCHKCDITFPDRMSLDEHNLSHKIKIKFSCRLCFKNFPKLYFLLQHLEVKHNQSNPGYFQFVLEHEHVDESVENEEISPAQQELQSAISSVEASDSEDQILDGDDVETSETRTCFVCGKSMETRAVLFTHLKEIHGIYKCKCLTCNKNFSCKADLQKHFADCHDTDFVVDLTEQIFRCFVCDLILESRFELKNHMPTHDRDGYNCNLCDMKYTSASSLRFHKRTVHWNLEGTRTCKICNNKIFTTMKAYESHMIGHFYDYLGPMRCTKCDVQLKNKRLYRLHLASHSSSLVCEHCGKVFPDQPSLRHHVVTHELCENCPICGKSLNKYSLKTHIAKVHGDKKKAECPECGKFVNENYLPNHIAEMHHNAEKFDRRKRICDFCGKKFKRPGLLKSHLVVHTGDKPYECEVCGKRFGYKTALNTHYTTHKGFKPHKCSYCDQSFWLIRHRLAHMKREHGYVNPDQKYPCTYCEKRFKQLAGLRLHMDEVHPEKVPGPKFYPCHVCKKEFKYRKSLREHLTVCAPDTEMGNIYGSAHRFGISNDFREIQEGEEIESENIVVQNVEHARLPPSASGTVPIGVCLSEEHQVVIHDQPEGVAYQTIYIQSDDPKHQGQVFVQDVGNQEQIILQDGTQEGELIVALPENCGEYNVDFLSSGGGIVNNEGEIGYAEIVVQDQ